MFDKTKLANRLIKTGVVLGTALLAMSQTLTPAYAKTTLKEGVGLVTGADLRLRESPNLTAKTLDYAPKNDLVVVIDRTGDWYHVVYNKQEGYMSAKYISVVTKENAELGYGKVSGDVVNIRSGPNTNSSIVTRVTPQDAPYIIGMNEGWYKVIVHNKIGYIRSDYLELTEIPYENADSDKSAIFIKDGKIISIIDPSKLSAPTQPEDNKSDITPDESPVETPTRPSEPAPEPPKEDKPQVEENTSDFGARIVSEAEKYLGIYYKWGGTSPSTGFDCSGFVYYVFNQCGFPLSRIMSTQYKQGTPVAKADLQPGDIVFFQGTYTSGMSHTGIYVGGGMFIHSPSTGKTISYANLYSDYYIRHWYGACRITP